VILLHFGYLIAVNQTTAYAVTPLQRFALMPLALIMTNWEICRKLRHPKDETGYTTYSKLWGYKRAGAVALILNAGIAVTAVSVLLGIGVAWYWALLYIVGHLLLAWPLVNYLQAKKLKRSMKDWSEYLILWVVGYLTLVSWVA
jgi:4-hydroxybenzoate polyprenyltransferase